MTGTTSKQGWSGRIQTGTGRIALVGYATIGLFAGSFAYWAATAPLSGAAIAPGVVAAAGLNIVIQHLEGGIVREIEVKEGDRVAAGTPLIALDTTASAALLNRLTNQYIALHMRAARLKAERDLLDEMTIPNGLVADSRGFDLAEVAAEQEKEFRARQARYVAEREILNQRVAALHEAVTGLEAQKKAGEDQLAVVRDEMLRKKDLLDKGLTNRSEYTALLRSEAELIGRTGAIQSQIASSSTQIVEARQQIERATTTRVEQAVSELNEVRASIVDIEEQMNAAAAVLARTTIRAPVDGIIVRKLVNSRGSVVRAGEPILELLPTTPDLVIEARLSPLDVDTVHVGQTADLMFSALNTRTTPRVNGTVTYVSADRLIDTSNGQPFFIARLKITDSLPSEISEDQIFPGMPVETFILKDDRTFFEYLVKPVYDSFSHAFREE